MRVLFFGSCEFSCTSLRYLLHSNLASEVHLVTPPTPNGPLYQLGRRLGLPIHVAPAGSSLKYWDIPSNSELASYSSAAALDFVDDGRYFDLGLVVSFGYFLPPRILRHFRHGSLNVHPSLLPKYRGAAPIQHCLINGDSVTGVSIIDLDPTQFDTGAILKQSQFRVSDASSTGELENVFYDDLHDRLRVLGARDLVEVVSDLDTFQKHRIRQEDITGVSNQRAPKLKKEMASVDLRSVSSFEVDCLYRGIGSTFNLHSNTSILRGDHSEVLYFRELLPPSRSAREIKLLSRKFPALVSGVELPPGTVFWNELSDTLFAKCGLGTQPWVGIRSLRIASNHQDTFLHPGGFVSKYRIRQFQSIY